MELGGDAAHLARIFMHTGMEPFDLYHSHIYGRQKRIEVESMPDENGQTKTIVLEPKPANLSRYKSFLYACSQFVYEQGVIGTAVAFGTYEPKKGKK